MLHIDGPDMNVEVITESADIIFLSSSQTSSNSCDRISKSTVRAACPKALVKFPYLVQEYFERIAARKGGAFDGLHRLDWVVL